MKGKTFPGRAWFCLLLAMVAGVGAFAQNPFELTPRLEKSSETHANPVADTAPVNPFDIATQRAPSPAARPEAAEDTAVASKTPSSSNEARYRRFLFTMVIQIFLLLTILFTLFRSIPGRVYRAFVNDNMLSQLHREQGAIVSIPYFLFYLFFFFNAGFFLFLLTWHYNIPLADRHWKSFALITGALMALFAGKHALLKILEFALPARKQIRVYSFTIIIFGIFLGFLLIPLNLLIAYGPSDAVPAIIYLALVVTGLVYAFRFLRGLLIAGRYAALHLFHFLLYICTVEFAPALILAKTVHLAIAGN